MEFSFPPLFLGWFIKKGYLQGAFWAIMICVVSVTNDVFMRLLGGRLPVAEIIFFRFLFSMIATIPLMLSQGTKPLYTQKPGLHFLRAAVGVCAIGACCYSVTVMPLSENTTLMFSQPLFFLPLAMIFLREKIDLFRWSATCVGFLGLILIIQPGTQAFNVVALAPLSAALFFALLDILAKKMVHTESTMSLLFYFAFGTTLCSFIPALFLWKTPTLTEFFYLILLGVGGNLIQVCLIRAFSATDASGLMPFRYVEFIFSALAGFVLFAEVPSLRLFVGAPFIIAGAFFISYHETRKEKNRS